MAGCKTDLERKPEFLEGLHAEGQPAALYPAPACACSLHRKFSLVEVKIRTSRNSGNGSDGGVAVHQMILKQFVLLGRLIVTTRNSSRRLWLRWNLIKIDGLFHGKQLVENTVS